MPVRSCRRRGAFVTLVVFVWLAAFVLMLPGCDGGGTGDGSGNGGGDGGHGGNGAAADNTLVVYCAHDEVFSRRIIDLFQDKTGIAVSPRFDTEATKSLGLTELLVREKDSPRCDVFWNNQLLGTADLKVRGVLQPYRGPGYQRIPAAFKDPEGEYTGFAARLRVYIVNTDKHTGPLTNEAMLKMTLEGGKTDMSQFAIAKPMFGTTLSHYAVLWDLHGAQATKQWHRRWREANVVERGGNATVMELVAEGICTIGYTDTDDYFIAKDNGKPVAMLPVRVGEDQQRTICIPNTVAIIKGARHLDNAKKFVAFMLSEELEVELANSKARQIPLGPVDQSKLSDEVKQLTQWAKDGYDLTGLQQDRAECLQWLKDAYDL